MVAGKREKSLINTIKMDEKLKYIFIFLGFLIIGFTAHELTHEMIYRIYHCENIHYEFELTGLYVKANCPDSSVRLPQAINEVVGYLFIPFLSLISIMIIRLDATKRIKEE